MKIQQLRNNEYYNFQKELDEIYNKSKNNINFKQLMKYVIDERNIRLAYRNIKNNTGGKTKGVDGKTIESIKSMSDDEVIKLVKDRFKNYIPDAVKRIEIPKENGKTRPLGVPTIRDRLLQQCLLQVLEPICEAKFYDKSHAFRPNRSPQTALAQSYLILNKQYLHYAVKIDIENFFDNINHQRLMRQMWNMGIRDKKVLKIIKLMLKTEVKFKDGTVEKQEKGTPQGGVLSPLLSNIVLNELDWWLADQWDKFKTKKDYAVSLNSNGSLSNGPRFRVQRESGLKEMVVVRYADDFVIYTTDIKSAYKIKHATTSWLEQRLNLTINEDKSKVYNLKKSYVNFLGIDIKVKRKRNKYVVHSRIPKEKIKSIKKNLVKQVKKIQHSSNLGRDITKYNSMVMGIHNYYRFATMVSIDVNKISYDIDGVFKHRMGKSYSKKGTIRSKRVYDKYGKSKYMRYIGEMYILPISYIRHTNPKHKPYQVNKYTEQGRQSIHKTLGYNSKVYEALINQELHNNTIEYKDNRISIYVAQKGKCKISNEELSLDDIHCHHIKPKHLEGTDDYRNLVILHKKYHVLIHMVEEDKILEYIKENGITEELVKKVNYYRTKVKNKRIKI